MRSFSRLSKAPAVPPADELAFRSAANDWARWGELAAQVEYGQRRIPCGEKSTFLGLVVIDLTWPSISISDALPERS
jgi:hypothetical protein